jgi:hypothetical protein
MAKQSEVIAKLRAEVDELKQAEAARKPIQSTDADVAAWKDQMHRMSEARMSNAVVVSPEQLRAYEEACPPSVARDIAARGGIKGPSADGISGQLTATHHSAGLPGSNGWQNPRPLGPMPGQSAIERIANYFEPHGPDNPLRKPKGEAKPEGK